MNNKPDREFEFQRYLQEYDYLKNRFYNDDEWIQIREEVRKRENNICQMCKEFIVGRSIVHHVEPITMEQLKNEDPCLYDKSKLILVCLECHNSIDHGKARKNRYTYNLKKQEDLNFIDYSQFEEDF